MARKAIALVFGILLVLLLSGGCKFGENVYESPQGYSFSYPDPWKIAEGPYEKTFIFHADPDVVLEVDGKSDKISFVFTAGLPVEGPVTRKALKEELAETIAGWSVRLPDFELISSEVFLEADVKGQELVCSTRDDKGKPVRVHFVRLVSTKGDGFFLNATLVSTPTDFRYSEADFENIINSVKLPEEGEQKEKD